MDLLFNHAWADAQAGSLDDYVSGNNDADGPYLLQWAREHLPQWEDALRQRLVAWGGNASGQMVANIDNLGHVHPDTMWWHHDLGSVRERPFSQIWNDTSDPLMAGLKQHPRPVQGRCAGCQYLTICNGNTRVRAQQLTGNPWFEDPGCYLTDAEVGASSTPFESPAKHERRRTIEIAHA
jgi:radical SAM protein with 4Fe4S-binding SPASM domain